MRAEGHGGRLAARRIALDQDRLRMLVTIEQPRRELLDALRQDEIGIGWHERLEVWPAREILRAVALVHEEARLPLWPAARVRSAVPSKAENLLSLEAGARPAAASVALGSSRGLLHLPLLHLPLLLGLALALGLAPQELREHVRAEGEMLSNRRCKREVRVRGRGRRARRWAASSSSCCHTDPLPGASDVHTDPLPGASDVARPMYGARGGRQERQRR